MDITRRELIRSAILTSSAMVLPQPRRGGLPPTPENAVSSQPILYDKDGLIVHKNMDGGDTAQREGWYWLGVNIREKVTSNPWPVARTLTFPEVLRLLEPNGDGVFYRHPKLSPWNNPYSKEYGFSRDQMVPLVAAMGVWGYTEPLRRLWNALPQDIVGGMKHTFNGEWVKILGQKTVYTGDIVGPATVNLFRRAWSEDPSNDLSGERELRVNVDLRVKAAKDPDNTGDDLNLIVMLLTSILRFKSGISTDGVNIYRTSRPDSYGSYLGEYRKRYGVDLGATPQEVKRRLDEGIAAHWTKDASSVFGAIRWYHRAEVGANPALAELYAPIIHAYFE